MIDAKTLYFKLKRLNNLLSREELKKVDEVITAFYDDKIAIIGSGSDYRIGSRTKDYSFNGLERPTLMYLIDCCIGEDEFLKAVREGDVLEFRKLSTADVQALCIKKDWYTKGDSEDYKHLLWDLVVDRENVSTNDLIGIANDILEHS
ncbi:MAG: hypothetical protein J1E41_05405, partial [Ruminococcus sp.]|nr:hypothetical protein [Ruminococcus sp.]